VQVIDLGPGDFDPERLDGLAHHCSLVHEFLCSRGKARDNSGKELS
jgi:hypothetical protein